MQAGRGISGHRLAQRGRRHRRWIASIRRALGSRCRGRQWCQLRHVDTEGQLPQKCGYERSKKDDEQMVHRDDLLRRMRKLGSLHGDSLSVYVIRWLLTCEHSPGWLCSASFSVHTIKDSILRKMTDIVSTLWSEKGFSQFLRRPASWVYLGRCCLPPE